MPRRVGNTTVIARNERHMVAVGSVHGELRGEGRRDLDGCWTVAKIQWDGANGAGRTAGFPGGSMTVATVPSNVAKDLQKRMVRAMLGAL